MFYIKKYLICYKIKNKENTKDLKKRLNKKNIIYDITYTDM